MYQRCELLKSTTSERGAKIGWKEILIAFRGQKQVVSSYFLNIRINEVAFNSFYGSVEHKRSQDTGNGV